MLDPDAPRDLLAIASEVRALAAPLDTTDRVCECCTLRKATNWPEAQAARELAALADKAERLSQRLARLLATPDPADGPRAGSPVHQDTPTHARV